jgi:2-phospho-L-lactate/phosphoenolpyruvate guanylyltransferase
VRAIVVPYRANGKSRLPEPVRAELALAMLGDVLTACTVVGPTTLVSGDPDAIELANEFGVGTVADPGDGQGHAVTAALAGLDGPALVVNADLPCVVPADLRLLAELADAGAVGLVEAADGTTNALAVPAPALFAPLYGPGSALRFRDHAAAHGVDCLSAVIPNLADDVDTIDDLLRVGLRAGPRTQAALGRL